MMTFAPNYSVLEEPQRAVLPELRFAARRGFTLYGGTAIALHLGHRQSVDFDFFSTEPFDKDRILRDSSLMRDGQVLQNTGHTLTLSTVRAGGPVKISFVASLKLAGRVAEPSMTNDGILQVAALDDLFATKVKVILDRAESKDYADIAALIRSGQSLEVALNAARTIYGPSYQWMDAIKALTYFEGGNLSSLERGERGVLIKAASTNIRVLDIPARSRSLSGKVLDFDRQQSIDRSVEREGPQIS